MLPSLRKPRVERRLIRRQPDGSGESGARLNAMHRILSRINRAILRMESPDALYLEACHIVVDSGLFDLVWIGLLDPVGERLRPMAHCGEPGALPLAICRADEQPGGKALPAWTVLRQRQTLVCNRLALQDGEPGAAEARTAGLKSMASLPLREFGQVVGVLELYSRQEAIFSSELLELIGEIAADLSFAMEHLLQEQQRLVAETKIRYLAYYDPQTGLPNRALLEQRLAQLVGVGGAESLVLLDIKLQRLEPILRVHGHAVVDGMLRTLAQRLESCRTGAGLVAQLAQDEFALVVLGLSDRDAVRVFARAVLRLLTLGLSTGREEAFVGAVIGVAIYPWDERVVHQLLPRARAATASALAGGEVCLYSPELDRDSAARLEMESELHRALARSEFELHYQPQLSLKTGAMVGVEALLRWRHPNRGMIGPGLFIPVLESCGLMVRVGEWVLRTACAQNRAWQDAGLPPLRMAVNLSAQQFRQPGLVEVVRRALAESGLAAEWLELELTESIILEDAERTIRTMHELKQLGLSLSLDDFGTGYSSLSYLRRFPVDRIKLDQSFVRDVARQASAATLAKGILAMAHNLGLATIAEGVEEEEQLGYLRNQSCHEMQGYLFGRPMPAEGTTRLLRERRRLSWWDGRERAPSTVLVVDGDGELLEAVREVLGRDGLEVLTAETAGQGFALLATRPVGAVISDMAEPAGGARDFLNEVRGLYPDSVRILLTRQTSLVAALDVVNRADLFRVLTIPWEERQLREAVRDALQHYQACAAALAPVDATQAPSPTQEP